MVLIQGKNIKNQYPLFIKIDDKNIATLWKVSSGLQSQGQEQHEDNQNNLKINLSVNSENALALKAFRHLGTRALKALGHSRHFSWQTRTELSITLSSNDLVCYFL